MALFDIKYGRFDMEGTAVICLAVVLYGPVLGFAFVYFGYVIPSIVGVLVALVLFAGMQNDKRNDEVRRLRQAAEKQHQKWLEGHPYGTTGEYPAAKWD
ncbi:hypothetical protein ACWEQ4_01185 [Rhodococcus sp. NPDC003994]